MADFQSLADAINEMKEELSGIGSEQVTFLDSTESLSNQMLVVQREMLVELRSIREGLNFEKLADSLVKRSMNPVKKALDDAGLSTGDIDEVILVGGSTRIPIITKTIEQVMKKPPLKGVNVDEAVAAGAAIYAGLKSKKNLNEAQKKAISNVKLQDVCNFYLGTLVQEDDPVLNRSVTSNLILIDTRTLFFIKYYL